MCINHPTFLFTFILFTVIRYLILISPESLPLFSCHLFPVYWSRQQTEEQLLTAGRLQNFPLEDGTKSELKHTNWADAWHQNLSHYANYTSCLYYVDMYTIYHPCVQIQSAIFSLHYYFKFVLPLIFAHHHSYCLLYFYLHLILLTQSC